MKTPDIQELSLIQNLRSTDGVYSVLSDLDVGYWIVSLENSNLERGYTNKQKVPLMLEELLKVFN